MTPKINMIGIITNNFDAMLAFYRDILGFKIKLQMEKNYVEFENQGVRLAISTGEVMAKATGDETYKQKKQGHSFELAFQANSPEQLDKEFSELISRGAKEIKSPADMPWGQRTAFFADPDGNIHEMFAEL